MQYFFRYMRWAVLPLAVLLPISAAEPGITKKQADEILDELRQIRQLLEKQLQAGAPQAPQPSKVKVGVSGAYSIGSDKAPLTMVEFTDFQCPFCQRFYSATFSQIKKNYIDTGKVRFVSRDLPLDIHPNAMRAANAGRCAGEQGQFWPMRDRMAANPEQLDMNHLVADAAALKLNVDTFRECVDSQKYKDAIQKDIQDALSVGADGTPAFVIGKTSPDGVEGELVVGAMPYQVFDGKFQQLAR